MCPKYRDAPFALSFSMFSGLWKWGEISNLALKLDRSYHREHVYKFLIGLQLNQKLPQPKTLTKTLTWCGTDERYNRWTNERTNAQTRKHNAHIWGIKIVQNCNHERANHKFNISKWHTKVIVRNQTESKSDFAVSGNDMKAINECNFFAGVLRTCILIIILH